jgi:hypothetical protein
VLLQPRLLKQGIVSKGVDLTGIFVRIHGEREAMTGGLGAEITAEVTGDSNTRCVYTIAATSADFFSQLLNL